MAKELPKEKTNKYDKVTSVDAEIKSGNLSKEEKVELKSYKIYKALKKQKYVRN